MRATAPVCTRGSLGPDGEDKAQNQSRGGVSPREEGPWDSIMQTLVFNFQTPWALPVVWDQYGIWSQTGTVSMWPMWNGEATENPTETADT